VILRQLLWGGFLSWEGLLLYERRHSGVWHGELVLGLLELMLLLLGLLLVALANLAIELQALELSGDLALLRPLKHTAHLDFGHLLSFVFDLLNLIIANIFER